MGWGSCEPVSPGAVRTGVRRIRIADIVGAHSPDEFRVEPWGGDCEPIDVELDGGWFRMVDGVSRMTAAKRAGESMIPAEVWQLPA